MSELKRLHPITMVFECIKALKQVVIPIVIWFFLTPGKGEKTGAIWDYLPQIGVGIFILLILVSSIIQWSRYTYRIEEMELRIEHGLFVKKKRYIPFERIQSLDLSEGILHRPFGLVKVKIETAGSSGNEAEAELTAIKKMEAFAIQKVIADAKNDGSVDSRIAEGTVAEVDLVYKISGRQLFFIASTSSRAGVVISAFLAFIFQLENLIPYERLFNEMEQLIRFGVMFVTIGILIVLICAWLLSVLITFLKFNDFTVRKVNNDLIITRGLLEKRTTTIPLQRIQALKISESPVRQPFGYASVLIESAGGAALDQDSSSIILLPVVKRNEIANTLATFLSDYQFDLPLTPVPKWAKRRYLLIKLVIATIIVGAVSAFFWPYGLLSAVLLLLMIAWGLSQYKSAGWNITDQQLTLRYRNFQQHTILMKKNRVQSLETSVNWFQKKAKLATISAKIKSGPSFQEAAVFHLDQSDAREIYAWYRHQHILEDRINQDNGNG